MAMRGMRSSEPIFGSISSSRRWNATEGPPPREIRGQSPALPKDFLPARLHSEDRRTVSTSFPRPPCQEVIYLAAHTNLGWVFGVGITGLGIAWVVTTSLAVAAIRRGFIQQHREWMIRSYMVTFAFVTFRASWSALQAAGVGTQQEQLAASSWFCWAVPLLVVEALLQGRKIFGKRELRH
jgi:hypothetical protein